jgi:hypothetical protein
VLATEDVLEARRGFERGLLLPLQDQLRDETAEAPGRDRDALVVGLEQLPVGARLVVVAVEEREARDADEVAVAPLGLREHREVEDLVLRPLGTLEPRGVGEVALQSEHGFDAGGLGRGVQLQRAVHVPVVGDSDGRLPVGGCGRDDLADPRGPVEHRVLGVEVQVDEGIRQRCLA